MEKENSASGGGGGGGGEAAAAAATPGATSTSEKLQADQANPLLDPTALFGGKSFSLVFFPSPSPLTFITPACPLSSDARHSAPLRDKRHRYTKRRR